MQKAQPIADVENRMAESIIVLLRPMLSLNIPEKSYCAGYDSCVITEQKAS